MEPLSASQTETNSNNIEEVTQTLDNLSVRNDSSTKICIPFTKYGHCRFDKNCKFLHQHQNSAHGKISDCKITNKRYLKTKSQRKDPGVCREVLGGEKLQGSSASLRQNISGKLCRYFLAGRCYKENCNFKHTLEPQLASKVSTNNTNVLLKTKKKSIPLCHYFKRGDCLKGDSCKFYHSSNVPYSSETVLITKKNDLAKSTTDLSNCCEISYGKNESKEQDVNQSPNVSSIYTTDCKTSCLDDKNDSIIKDSNLNEESPVDFPHCKEINSDQPSNASPNVYTMKYKTPRQVLKLFDLPLSENEILVLRETEITQMKKRYPGCIENKTNAVFSIEFTPSDPDWVHDVTTFHLQIEFPYDYPVEVCKIDVLQSSDFILEPVLRIIFRHLNQCVSDWLHERHLHLIEMKKVELLFRSFLRWFDKNLKDMFSVCFKKKKESSNETNILCEENITESKANNNATQLTSLPETRIQTSGMTKPTATSSYKAQKNGFHVSLTGLELVEGIGTLSCTKLDLTLLCRRCKTSVHVSTTPKKNKSMMCSKCSLVMECNFEPSIIHQFSNVLGTVYLVGCTGLDVNLIECAFVVDCLNCSKQVPIEGLHPGSKQKFWCVLCNQKFLLSVQSSKFQASSVAYTNIKSEPMKKIERKKDVQIKEGAPLPEFGSCKHYKKSNRWFRFPCCGRVYPCDICHEEKEDGHEIKFASRIICGFCSKEQPFTKDKPCSGCSAQVTAKHASHWEGGKGCRNKIIMSRGDKKKYTGISKTVPKNSQVLSCKKKS